MNVKIYLHFSCVLNECSFLKTTFFTSVSQNSTDWENWDWIVEHPRSLFEIDQCFTMNELILRWSEETWSPHQSLWQTAAMHISLPSFTNMKVTNKCSHKKVLEPTNMTKHKMFGQPVSSKSQLFSFFVCIYFLRCAYTSHMHIWNNSEVAHSQNLKNVHTIHSVSWASSSTKKMKDDTQQTLGTWRPFERGAICLLQNWLPWRLFKICF